MTRRPIFIGGTPESCSTMLGRMLGRHSNLSVGHATNWLDWDWARRLQPDVQLKLTRLAAYLNINSDDTRVLSRYLGSPEVFLMILMEELARREGKERWVENTPANVAHVDRIWKAFPEAQIVHVICDTDDVSALLVESNRKIELKLPTVGPRPRRYMTVSHKSLVKSPEMMMQQITGFLEEPWEADVGLLSPGKSGLDDLSGRARLH